jgi:hypothetical protein
MSPEDEKGLDEWLDGVRGVRPASKESGFDPLDASIVVDFRSLLSSWEGEVDERAIADAWRATRAVKSRPRFRGMGWPFSMGLAAGGVMAVCSAFLFFGSGFVLQRQQNPSQLGTKSGTSRESIQAATTVIEVADPTSSATDLANSLARAKTDFSMEFRGRNLVGISVDASHLTPAAIVDLSRLGIEIPATSTKVLRIEFTSTNPR